MIKFFRKIRQKLLTENKFTTYFLYAGGEILLVVIGILIALAANNKMEQFRKRESAIEALQTLRHDITLDMLQLENYWTPRLKEQDEARDRLGAFLEDTSPIKDSLQFVIDVMLISNYFTFDHNRAAIENLVNTGSLKLIDNDELRSALLGYKRQTENIEEFDVLHRAFYLDLFGRIGVKIIGGLAYSQTFKFYSEIDTIKPIFSDFNTLSSTHIRSSGHLREFLVATGPPFHIKRIKYIELQSTTKNLLSLIDEALPFIK